MKALRQIMAIAILVAFGNAFAQEETSAPSTDTNETSPVSATTTIVADVMNIKITYDPAKIDEITDEAIINAVSDALRQSDADSDISIALISCVTAVRDSIAKTNGASGTVAVNVAVALPAPNTYSIFPDNTIITSGE